jgi:hypothetical protein
MTHYTNLVTYDLVLCGDGVYSVSTYFFFRKGIIIHIPLQHTQGSDIAIPMYTTHTSNLCMRFT